MNDKERELIVKTYYENNRSITQTYRKLRLAFGSHKRPPKSTISSYIKTYEKYGAIRNPNKSKNRRKSVQVSNATAALVKDVLDNPVKSLSQRSKQFGISNQSIRRILSNCVDENEQTIQLKPYIIKKIAKITNEQMEIVEHVKKINNLSDEKWLNILRLAKNQNDRVWLKTTSTPDSINIIIAEDSK